MRYIGIIDACFASTRGEVRVLSAQIVTMECLSRLLTWMYSRGRKGKAWLLALFDTALRLIREKKKMAFDETSFSYSFYDSIFSKQYLR